MTDQKICENDRVLRGYSVNEIEQQIIQIIFNEFSGAPWRLAP